eukprot:jgi/Chlat1/722/Chrsp104S01301
MQIRRQRGLLPPSEGICKVAALAWSPTNHRLAVATGERVVHLFDDAGERRDKFATKPNNTAAEGGANGAENNGTTAGTTKQYVVRGLAWSPDGTKLAVAQSDDIVFIYKLGLDWGEKKSICNKFPQSCAVTALAWASRRPSDLAFALSDGKVRSGALRTNRAATLYAHPAGSYAVAMATAPDGTGLISAHLDGSIYRFYYEDGAAGPAVTKFTHHACVPYALAWGEHIVAAGNDCKVVFYDRDGGVFQQFDYSSSSNPDGSDSSVREFTVASAGPPSSGLVVAVGSWRGALLFAWQPGRRRWEEAGGAGVGAENLYGVTAVAWKGDGSRLGVGSLCGSVDMYEACIKRQRYKGRFEFTYVTHSQVLVKKLTTGTRTLLKSHFGYEITKINVYKDQFVVANTPETLLVGDLETCKLSEVPWRNNSGGRERFFFDTPGAIMVHSAGELAVIEYGRNEIVGGCRTEHVSPFLLSVRLGESRGVGGRTLDASKRIAYLIDVQTIRIVDLPTGANVGTVSHDCRVDWLELNARASHLLFRDKRKALHLFHIAKQTRTTLVPRCAYAQWVPLSDVVVAQSASSSSSSSSNSSSSSLRVWYSLARPERAAAFDVKGDVVGIERRGGRTDVVVEDGVTTVNIALDEALVEFGGALESGDLERAEEILEPLDPVAAPEADALWQARDLCELYDAALAARPLPALSVAERCAASLGLPARARFLHKLNKIRRRAAEETGGDGMDHYLVRAQIAMLDKQWKVAEGLLLGAGRVDDAIAMYTGMHWWEAAIRVANAAGHPEAETLAKQHYQWLLQTGQEEAAGAVRESSGDFSSALSLYLRGGTPGRAASLILSRPSDSFDSPTIESVASALTRAGLHARAGAVFEHLGALDRAKEAYKKGKEFRRAVELCRRAFPAEVVSLELEWGEHLLLSHRADSAVSHFIEAGAASRALEAAVQAGLWTRAAQIAETQDHTVAAPYWRKIARQLEAAREWKEAERCLLRAGAPQEAVEMWARANDWDAAHKVAAQYMSEREVSALYLRRARELEALATTPSGSNTTSTSSNGPRYREAERLYLLAKEHDLAISMYKKSGLYDQMLRLVAAHRKELLSEAQAHVARALAGRGQMREAERHWVGAGMWREAAEAWKEKGEDGEGVRVARTYGPPNAAEQVAYAWAAQLGGEAGAALLARFGLSEAAIDYALEQGAFEHAFELANASAKNKLPEVHLKWAMFLEDEGRYPDAESAFILAGKPREAVDMWLHQRSYSSASRVASQHDPDSLPAVGIAQGKEAAENGEWGRAEGMFVKAGRAEMAVGMYKEEGKWEEAIRVAEGYVPGMVAQLHLELAAGSGGGVGGGTGVGETLEAILGRARLLEKSRSYSRAVDTYLQVTAKVTADPDRLEEAWTNAAKLAAEQVPERVPSIISEVSSRLLSLGRPLPAASLFEGIGAFREAIDVLMSARLWDEARSLAARQGGGGGGGGGGLEQYVEEQYVAHLVERDDGEALVRSGNGAAAVELFARQGQWNKVHEVAGTLGGGSAANALPELKTVLYRVVAAMKANAADVTPSVRQELDKLLHATHLAATRPAAERYGLRVASAKLAVSLLRHIGDVPADKALYEAGVAYLDLAEAMEGPEAELDEGSELLAATDIPEDYPLPEKHFLDEAQRESVRNWVLAMSMDQQSCGCATYAAGLRCGACGAESAPCCATGYPVSGNSSSSSESGGVQCRACHAPAIRDDWNAWTLAAGTCPWCSATQNPIY